MSHFSIQLGVYFLISVLLTIVIYTTGLKGKVTRQVYNFFFRIILVLVYPVLIFGGSSLIVYLVFWINFKINGEFQEILIATAPYAENLAKVFFVLTFLNLSFDLSARLLKESTKLSYEKFGKLSFWGRANRSLKRRWEWLPTVIHNISPLVKELSNNNGIRLLSPSANSGLDELTISQNLSTTLNIFVTMQASDYAEMPSEKSVRTENYDFKYIPKLHVKDIKQHVTDPVQVIWDMKGCLWYSAVGFIKKNKEQRVKHTLQLYYELLDIGGIVIIDDAERKAIRQIINELLILYIPWIFYYGENSTYKLIGKQLEKDKEIEEMFHIDHVGTGRYRIVVLRKKPLLVEDRIAV